MSDGPRKCPGGCDEVFSATYWEYEGVWSEVLEDTVCTGCYEADGYNVSTILYFSPDGLHGRVLLGDLTVAAGTLEELYDSEIPQWLADLFPDGKVTRHYARTDGWRGYYDTTAAMTGVTKLADGWITGDWGDGVSARKAPARDLGEYLTSGDAPLPPRPLYWILEPTSNVFSTATELFVKDGDEDAVTAWLADIGYPVDTVDAALG